MSLIARLRRALRDDPQPVIRYESPFASPNHLAGFVRPDWMPAGTMSRAVAMEVPAVARARRVICNAVARNAIRAYRGDEPLDVQPTWIDRTDGPVSPYHRMVWTVDDLLFHGWSCWAVQRDGAGRVVAADRMPYDAWRLDDEGRVVYHDRAGDHVADASSVVLIPGSDEGILARPAALQHAADLLRAAAKAAQNPSAHIDLHQTNDVPITEHDRERLVAAWVAARRGDNAGVAFSSAGIEVRELGSPAEHLLIEGRNAAALDVARTCGIPGQIVDATTPSASLTYESADAKLRDLVDFGLSAFMTPISARLGMDDVSPAGTRVAFDLEALIGPGRVEGAPDDGGGSSRPAAEPAGPAAPPPAGSAVSRETKSHNGIEGQ